MQFYNIPSDMEVFSSNDDSNLLKVKLRIVNIGSNPNKSKFSQEAIDDAKSTLSNIPILGYLKYDEDDEVIDFDGHNMVTKIVESTDGFKISTKYLERPIGVIPSDSEITYEEYNDQTYLCATGYVWKCYANEGYTLLMESDEKSVSMEISVSDGEVDSSDGFYNIKKFTFLGVTVLGDDVMPGIEGANITKYSNMMNYKKAIEEICNEIYSMKKEDDTVSENIEPAVELTTEPVIEPQLNNLEFGLSVENLRDQACNQISTQTITKKNYWDEEYEARAYWYRDLLPNDNVVVVESSDNYSYYGVPYSVNGDSITLDFDNKKEYISEWREKTGTDNDSLVYDLQRDEIKDIVLAKFQAKEDELNTINSELEGLKVFKKSIDDANYASEIEEVISTFTLEEDEISEFKAKVLNREITKDQFTKELYAIQGMKYVENMKNKKFSKDTKESDDVIIKINHQEEPKPKPYGGILG